MTENSSPQINRVSSSSRKSSSPVGRQGRSRNILAGAKLTQVKSAFAERAAYKDILKQDGLTIEEDKNAHKGAAPVLEQRNRSSIKAGEILVQRQPIPVEYFIGAVARNPFSGKVAFHRVQPGFDFTHVDLFDRDWVMATPDALCTDMYLFRPEVLGVRSWIYHSIFVIQEKALRGEKNFGGTQYAGLVKLDVLKAALAFSIIEQNTSGFGRYSPFQPISVSMALLCFTVNIPLMIVAVLMFFFSVGVTVVCNHPLLFKWHRFLSSPVRFLYFIIVSQELGNISIYAEQGRWIPLLGVIIAWVLLLLDHLLSDLANVSAYSLERRLEIQRILPGGVYLCSVHGGDALNQTQSKDDHISRELVGADYIGFSKSLLRNSVLIADIQGCLCELKPCSVEHWQDQYSHGRHVISAFSTRTFSNLRPDGEFFRQDGTYRNLYEIMGLKEDGSFLDRSDTAHRGKSFLGRRGTYEVSAPPMGVPGEPGGPPPPTEPPPPLAHMYTGGPPTPPERTAMAQTRSEDSSPKSTTRRAGRESRPMSAPAGPGSRYANGKDSSSIPKRPQSAAFQR